MLVMACVLRYIMSQLKPILRRQELDAFLCQAYSPDLMNAQYLQELTVRFFSLILFEIVHSKILILAECSNQPRCSISCHVHAGC